MKKKIIAASIALSLVLCILGCIVDATFFATSRIHVTNETYESSLLQEDLDGISIMVLSDLEYGRFLKEKKLERIINKINTINPDLVLFLGDVFDENYIYSTNDEEILVELLGSIDAKLGKFAVLGDFDIMHKETVSKLLHASGFEVLSNEVRRIHNEATAYLNLVAIEQSVISNSTNKTTDTEPNDTNPNNTQNNSSTNQNDETLIKKAAIESLYSSLSDSVFTITMTHNSDNLKYIPTGTSQLSFSGNSHGAQIMIPLLGAYHETSGNSKYIVGKYHTSTMEIYVSHGLGSTGMNMRLFSDPELVFYRLFKKKG